MAKQFITHFLTGALSHENQLFCRYGYSLYGEIVESRDLDENTLLEVDANGNMCALTVEHASTRADLKSLQLEGIAA